MRRAVSQVEVSTSVLRRDRAMKLAQTQRNTGPDANLHSFGLLIPCRGNDV
jgi:hypothetical protein